MLLHLEQWKYPGSSICFSPPHFGQIIVSTSLSPAKNENIPKMSYVQVAVSMFLKEPEERPQRSLVVKLSLNSCNIMI